MHPCNLKQKKLLFKPIFNFKDAIFNFNKNVKY
uniref:Uncharacterized protein n=1 Tax=Siphoviridae sp. ctj6w2 TaxID=2827919 RepID=A0A8S5T7I6_9CAUD|nr:MAG TPA: hypothetical protein [Siphoviridae sp. ctj6w2]DAK23672.1 MAG TPA: hypothetical protein [Caudoviricetes sp.]